MANKPYMPLMMGDWIRGTRGMKAEVRGVYISLLIHQYDNGFLPNDLEELRLIDPEIDKVWDKLSGKFQAQSDGKLLNIKLEEVRKYFNKQRDNGVKGGRPNNPNNNPNHNPNNNPNHNLHNEYDYDYNLNKKGVAEKFSKNGDAEKLRIMEFKENLILDDYALETICMTTKVDLEKCLKGLEIFVPTKISNKESYEWKNEKEFRRNFMFWIPSWVEREKKEIRKQGISPKRKTDLDP